MDDRSSSRRLFIVRAAASAAGLALAPILPALNWKGRAVNTSASPNRSLLTKRMSGLVLDTMNPLANFTREGGQACQGSPTVLLLNDGAITDIINLYAPHPDAAPGVAVDIFVAFMIRTAFLPNADSGLHFVINDGISKAVIAACIVKDGIKGIGLAGGASFWDPSNYPVFVPADWSRPTTVRIRRTVEGHGELVEVNGVAPSPRALVVHDLLAPRNRIVATFELGDTSPEALCEAEITQFYTETLANQVMGSLAFTTFRIGDTESGNKLRLRGDYALGGDTDGIAPTSRLFHYSHRSRGGAGCTYRNGPSHRATGE